MVTKADKEAACNRKLEILDDLKAEAIDGPYLAKKLKEEFEAEETKFFQKDGMVVEEENVIDWGTRQKARQDAHKLRGDYPPEKVDHKFNNLPTMTVVVHEAMKEENGSD